MTMIFVGKQKLKKYDKGFNAGYDRAIKNIINDIHLIIFGTTCKIETVEELCQKIDSEKYGEESHNLGFEEGYNEGRKEGYNKAIKNTIKKIYNTLYGDICEIETIEELCELIEEEFVNRQKIGYEEGGEKYGEKSYNAGYNLGLEEGNEEGNKEATKNAIDNIHLAIFNTTCEVKTIEELCEKIKDRFNKEYNEGHDDGYNEGFDDCRKEERTNNNYIYIQKDNN